MARRYGLRAGRCYLGCAAFITCAASLFSSTLAVPPMVKAVLIAMALASADLALGACWAVPIDIAPDHAGVITGFMNTLGNIGGLVGPLVVGIAVGPLALVDVPVLHHGAGVRRRRTRMARHRSDPSPDRIRSSWTPTPRTDLTVHSERRVGTVEFRS